MQRMRFIPMAVDTDDRRATSAADAPDMEDWGGADTRNESDLSDNEPMEESDRFLKEGLTGRKRLW